MLCTRCKKRQAVVFVQRLENGKPVQEGYCLTCARELHIQPVDDLMKRFNMTDDQLASMEEHMADLMQQAQESGAMMPMMDGDMQNPDDTGDDFVPGGSPVFPFGFGGTPKAEEKGEKSKKQRGRGQRKYLDTYCENLTQKAKDGKLDAYVGKTLKVGIRPEDIKDDEEFLEKHSTSHLNAEVEVSELMGAEIYLYLTYQGQNLMARVAPTSKSRRGDKIVVAMDTNKIHLFDPESEKTLLN